MLSCYESRLKIYSLLVLLNIVKCEYDLETPIQELQELSEDQIQIEVNQNGWAEIK